MARHKPHILEQKQQPLAPVHIFVKRSLIFFACAVGVITVSLLIGIAGYHWIAGFDWVSSFLNAAMIVSAMGPVDPLPNDASKIFASFYALFSGFILIAVMGIVLSPLLHRMMHSFHMEEGDK